MNTYEYTIDSNSIFHWRQNDRCNYFVFIPSYLKARKFQFCCILAGCRDRQSKIWSKGLRYFRTIRYLHALDINMSQAFSLISIATRSYNRWVDRSAARVSRGGLIDINSSSIGNPDSRPGVVHDCTHGKMATGPRAPVSALPAGYLSTLLLSRSLFLSFSFYFSFSPALSAPSFSFSFLFSCSLARVATWNFFTAARGGNGIKRKKGEKGGKNRSSGCQLVVNVDDDVAVVTATSPSHDVLNSVND